MVGGIQGACHLLDGGIGRVQGLRLLSGALSIQKRLLPGSCFVKMVGEIGQVRFKQGAIEALQRVSNAVMQRFADAHQQIAIDGLAGQRVTKGELFRRLLYNELGSDQLFDEVEEVLFVMMGECLQEGKIKAPSSHCRQG